MQYDSEFFTTNPQEGFIEVVAKIDLEKKVNYETQGNVGVMMSGWNISAKLSHNIYVYLL